MWDFNFLFSSSNISKKTIYNVTTLPIKAKEMEDICTSQIPFLKRSSYSRIYSPILSSLELIPATCSSRTSLVSYNNSFCSFSSCKNNTRVTLKSFSVTRHMYWSTLWLDVAMSNPTVLVTESQSMLIFAEDLHCKACEFS